MGIRFNAEEVFTMAERIENNGAAFYRRAAELTRDAAAKRTLADLAEWEATHEDLFRTLRALLTTEETGSTTFDPDEQTQLYLQEMANRHVFRTTPDVRDLLKGNESIEQILDIAIDFERDSIAFFEGMAKFIPEQLGSAKVRLLIEEEIGHIAFLVREKDRLRQA